MQFRSRDSAIALVLLAFALLAVACGPAAIPNPDSGEDVQRDLPASTPSSAPAAAEDAATPSPVEDEVDAPQGAATDTAQQTQAVADDTEPAGNRLSIQPDQAAVNDAGIPVGFTQDGHPYLGDPAAPVVIQEYSDFQCPFCSRFFAQTLPALIENQIRQGQAVLVYYDFPLTNIHPQAAEAANAARCAGDQGASAYWEMHDRIFADPSRWSNGSASETFISYAEDLDLDADDYAACLEESRYEQAIQADLATGSALGVTGTPSFFMNGQLLVGAQPLSVFNEAIETVIGGGQLASAAPSQPPQGPAAAPTPAAIAADGYAGAMGDPNAPITIVEYTDYQCPYCSRHSLETMPSIVEELVETGRVYYMLKDFPLDQLHPDARVAAAAARCAGEQGTYWDMHHEIFARQDEWAGSGSEVVAILAGFGPALGLDEAALLSCLESGRFDDTIQANLEEGVSLGVTGTPSFFIDGYPLSGARPFEHFEIATTLAEEGRLAEIYVPAEAEQQPEPPSGPRDVNTDGAFAVGDPDAPVTIVEFTDFQCPFCSRHFQQTYPQIKEDYVDTGLVRYVFKDFPLNSIHPQAAKAAEAARCAGDQGAFVEMHDLLFERQQQWGGRDPQEAFVGYAVELGLEREPFSQCLSTDKYASAVAADLQQGIELGVTGTPAFFLNGFPLTGAQPYSVFQQAIDSLMDDEGG